MVPELNIAPRTRGRAATPITVELVGELTPSDLALLATERQIKAPALVRLRDRHHALARALASGMKPAEAAMMTGYDISRISILQSDPTFAQLVSDYKTISDGVYADFVERTNLLSLTAVENLQTMLENDESPLPASMQLEIAKFAADRTGHAPVQKNVQVNVNANLGDRLTAARRRLAQTVEATVVASGDATDIAANEVS
jgi:hypothetical protein